MTDDPPADIRAVLSQLLEETRVALTAEDVETARETITSAKTVATNKLPASDRRATILHGCESVLELLDTDDVETATACEYVAAMERRLE